MKNFKFLKFDLPSTLSLTSCASKLVLANRVQQPCFCRCCILYMKTFGHFEYLLIMTRYSYSIKRSCIVYFDPFPQSDLLLPDHDFAVSGDQCLATICSFSQNFSCFYDHHVSPRKCFQYSRVQHGWYYIPGASHDAPLTHRQLLTSTEVFR